MMLGEKRITSAQCRAGRALLGWTREQLAAASNVSKMTLSDFETGKRQPYDRTLGDIEDALRAGGVAFLPSGADGGSGLRFRSSDDQSFTMEQAAEGRRALKMQGETGAERSTAEMAEGTHGEELTTRISAASEIRALGKPRIR